MSVDFRQDDASASASASRARHRDERVAAIDLWFTDPIAAGYLTVTAAPAVIANFIDWPPSLASKLVSSFEVSAG